MSVKELKFDNDYVCFNFVNDNTLIIKLDISCAVASLDRSQAHLLMLYLQEHLGNPIPTIEKKLWYCPMCDKYHDKDYVCVRI